MNSMELVLYAWLQGQILEAEPQKDLLTTCASRGKNGAWYALTVAIKYAPQKR
jgi:hypothetical protein